MQCRRLEHYDKGRFVEIFWEAGRVELTSGAFGSKGRLREESFASERECDEFIAATVARRLREGYVEVVPEVLRAREVRHVAPDVDWISRIAAAYDDDAPRLVYADHLEALGDPLGELIAVQCELARLDPWDPRCGVLREREETLMMTYRPRWLPKIEPDIQCTFRRGFVERIAPEPSVRTPAFEHLMTHAPLVRTLERDMRLDYWQDRAPWASAPRALLEQLTGIAIHNWSARVPMLGSLIEAPELARVDRIALRGCNTSPEHIQAIAPRAWREIELYNCWIGAGSTEVLLAESAPRLVGLTLDSIVIGDDGVRAIAQAPLRELRRLSLRRTQAAGLHRLSLSPSLVALAALDVSDNTDVAGLFEDPHLPALTELRLHQTALDDDGLTALLASPLAAQLRVLDLSSNRLTDARLLLEAELPALRVLDVSKNPLGERVRELKTGLPHVRVTARSAQS